MSTSFFITFPSAHLRAERASPATYRHLETPLVRKGSMEVMT